MAVIAMTREMGSLGKDVAEGLAKRLGARLIYSEIVGSLAEKMHMSPSVVTRFVQGKANLLERIGVDLDQLSLHTAAEVYDLAARGDIVIRGWGAPYLLRPIQHVATVRICAPLELRVKRLMERLQIRESKIALKEIRNSDSAHAAAMHRRFGVDWRDAEHYDLVLNTAKLSVDECVGQIIDLVNLPTFQESPELRAELASLALSAHVRAALKSDPQTSHANIIVEAIRNAQGGHVVLRGIVVDAVEKSAVEKGVFNYPGVSSVENQLKLMAVERIPKSHDG